MRLGKNILFFIFLLVFLPLSHAAIGLNFTDNAFSDNFNYASTYASHDYQYVSGGCGTAPTSPVNYAFGINRTNSCAFSYSDNIRGNFTNKADRSLIRITQDNTLLITYDYFHGNSTEENTALNVQLRDTNSAGGVGGNLFIDITHSKNPLITGFDNKTLIDMTKSGGKNCSFNYDRYSWNSLYIYFNFAQHTYSVKNNGNLMCSDYDTGSGLINISEMDILYTADDVSTPQYKLLDNIVVNLSEQQGQQVFTADASHVLFCDNFNYGTTLYSTKGWLVLNAGLSIDTEMMPINNKLQLIDAQIKTPSHQTGLYSYPYQTGQNLYTGSTYFSPVFSSEMTVNLTSRFTDTIASCFRYQAKNGADESVYDIALCPNGSAYYMISPAQNELCPDCVPINITFPFKVITYMSQKAGMPFNSTVANDSVSVFINQSQYIFNPAWNDRITRVQQYFIAKNSDAAFYVDDYCVYVGTDKLINNIAYFFASSYTPSNETVIVPTGTGDMVDNIQSLYSTLGLKTTASRIVAGLLILIVINALLVALMVNYGFNFGVFPFIIINLLAVIGLVYIGLIPVWIVIILGILFAAGLLLIIAKMLSE